MTLSQKRGTICHQLREAFDDWDINYGRIEDVKDPEDRTLTFYVTLQFDYDCNDVEGAVEEICEDWNMEYWWDDEDEDVFVLQCSYD